VRQANVANITANPESGRPHAADIAEKALDGIEPL
jgi:hypothetical protein